MAINSQVFFYSVNSWVITALPSWLDMHRAEVNFSKPIFLQVSARSGLNHDANAPFSVSICQNAPQRTRPQQVNGLMVCRKGPISMGWAPLIEVKCVSVWMRS